MSNEPTNQAMLDWEDQNRGWPGNLPAHRPQASTTSFQARVAPWMLECFGAEVAADRLERGDRLLEEVFELLQSGGYPRERVTALQDYTWNRPAGEPEQEVGGVMVTLAAYCLAHGLDMHAAGELELARILRPEVVEKIRLKQAAKARDIPFSPLPEVSIPQAWLGAQAEPDPALLVSMAMRRDHGFALLDEAKQQVQLAEMRKLWEEVVGLGFYTPANRSRYTAMLVARPAGGAA